MTVALQENLFTIELFEPTDAQYEAIVAVHNAVWPEYPETAKDWQRWDRLREPQYFFQRHIVRWHETGAVVAYGHVLHTYWTYHPDRYHIEADVLPEYRRHGIGTALYNRFMDILAERNPLSVEVGTKADRHDALRFIEQRGGYELKTTLNISKLDLARFDPGRFPGAVERVTDSGLVIKSLAELMATDPDHKHKIYDMIVEIEQDIPWHESFTPPPFEQWEQWFDDSPNRINEAHLYALDGERYVGVTMLFRNEVTDEKIFTGLTGVRRDYRRRGVALGLKVAALSWAQANLRTARGGVPDVFTDNEENNPMYQINVVLGFKPEPPRLVFVKTLRDE